MTSSSSVSVIIPAAGIGSRMQNDTPKQYLHIAEKTILEHSIDAFLDHPLVQRVIVCLHKQDTLFATMNISRHKKISIVEGGLCRAESVRNGLSFLSATDDGDWVLVHDAARPGLSQSALNRLIDARNNLTLHGNEQCYNGAILAIPVVDTVKKARTDMTITTVDKTLNRNQLWLAQTPQMFKTEHLLEALNAAFAAGQELTDEASAMEYMGGTVTLIHGEKANLKITQNEDLALAEFYLSQQQRENL